MDDTIDNVWKALADATRRAILDHLRDGPRTTGDLAGRFEGLTRFGVMKHLAVLESVGLVIVERRGRERWNHLNAVPLRRVYERWVSRYEDRWAGSLLRLKDTMETTGKGERAMGAKLLDQPARVARTQCEVLIDAPREAVYRAWFERTQEWFLDKPDEAATKPFLCEERMGGRFYQQLPDGGFNVLGEITMLKPGHKIRLRGDCTMPEAVLMNMTISFEDDGQRTRVRVDHRMMGEFGDDLPAGFEDGWMDGLTKLKALMETGRA